MFFLLSYVLFCLVILSIIFSIILLSDNHFSAYIFTSTAEASFDDGKFYPGEILRTQKDLDLFKVYKLFMELMTPEQKQNFFSQIFLHPEDTCGNSMFRCGAPTPRTILSGRDGDTPPTYDLNATIRSELLSACYRNLSVFNNSLKTDYLNTVKILNVL